MFEDTEHGDFFALRPITLWRCNGCGYVDLVRDDNDPLCDGCGEATDGTTHTYRPDPVGVRSDRGRLESVPDSLQPDPEDRERRTRYAANRWAMCGASTATLTCPTMTFS
jgi:hypothetical protein